MATLIANADGNLTGASTFCATETGALSNVLNRSTNATLAAATSVTSVTFTVTNANIIDGVLLYIRQAATSATGTFKVDLQKGGVSQASVTVNKTDLPDSTVAVASTPPVFFKFTGTATGDGGANWTLVLTTTGTVALNYYCTIAFANQPCRALRTTTAATPAAADNLFIVGELTGAGTKNIRAVTMDSTAATVYGNGSLSTTLVAGGLIAVGNWASLSYGTTASTNYILRIAGDLIVYQNGTLNIGASGAEIPRTSTAVLEFQPVSADGDFGLQIRDGTLNTAGLSRTSGKNIVKCKLTANVASASIIAFGINATSTITTVLDAANTSLRGAALTDTVTNSAHYVNYAASATVINTDQTGTIWLARGTGLNNRYVRVAMQTSNTLTNGFYADVDLQAGTVGTCTAAGTGTATSASITPSGTGFVVRITGKISTVSNAAVFQIHSCAVAGTITYAGNATQNFLYDRVSIVTASSIPDTTLNVDEDTGWLSGDVICVAATTRTAAECELFQLNANAGSSSMTSALYPFSSTTISTHHGTSPIQAEIGLLTRNVKIRSTSSTLMAYVYCTAASVANLSWTEIYYCGANVTDKEGCFTTESSATLSGAKSISYCSMHDTDKSHIYVDTNSNSLNLSCTDSVFWKSTNTSIVLTTTISNGDYTFDNNLVMLSTTYGFDFSDGLKGTVTNNTVAGCTIDGFVTTYTVLATEFTFSGNSAHACDNGLNWGVQYGIGAIADFTSWRNLNYGVLFASGGRGTAVQFTNLTSFGNADGGLYMASLTDVLQISGAVICGDSTYASANGIVLESELAQRLTLADIDMNPGTGIFVPNSTADIHCSGNTTSVQLIEATFNDCRFGAPLLINTVNANRGDLCDKSFMSFQRFNKTNGDHRTEFRYGQIRTDSSIYNTGSPSMRMTPTSASYKLESAARHKGKLFPIDSGQTIDVSVWVRKDATYNGNQPRLIARANHAIGIDDDEVLATCSDTITGPDADFSSVKLLMGFEGADAATGAPGMTDESGAAHGNATVNGGAQIDTAQLMFGGSSLLLDGTGDYVTFADHNDWTMGAQFTMEASVRYNAVSDSVWISQYSNTAAFAGWMFGYAAAEINFLFYESGGTSVYVTATWTPSTNIWYKVAVDRDGSGVVRLYVDGTFMGKLTLAQTFRNSGQDLMIGGRSHATPRYMNGWIDEVRITNGVARYASDSGYTVAGQPLPRSALGTGTATWVQLTGTTPTATDDGVVEIIVDCDGTAGFINVDDWSAA